MTSPQDDAADGGTRRPGRTPASARLAVINAVFAVAAVYLALTDARGWWLLAAMFVAITLYWLRVGSRRDSVDEPPAS